jgi:hypothetical protein
MANIRSTVLQSLFSLGDSAETAQGNAKFMAHVASEWNTEATAPSPIPGLEQDLREISDRLDILCTSSFNVATLAFSPGSQNTFADQPPSIADCERFLATLNPLRLRVDCLYTR